MKLSDIQAWKLLRATFLAWKEDFAQSMGAALAFYTMFSITPLILIAIEIAGRFFGIQTARGEILSQLSGLVGKDGETAVQSLLASASDPSRRKMAAGIGVAVFVIGAMSVFNELQDALNRIWHVHGRKARSGVMGFVRSRLLSFGMVLSIAFLLLVSLIISAVLSAVGRSWTPSVGWQFTAQILNVTIGFALITAMIAMIYKVIPQTKVSWRDVWVGAITTSILFTFGKLAIGVYLGRSAVASGFGAVGSLAVFLLWVYYSAQIFLFGAEFTSIYSRGRSRSASS